MAAPESRDLESTTFATTVLLGSLALVAVVRLATALGAPRLSVGLLAVIGIAAVVAIAFVRDPNS